MHSVYFVIMDKDKSRSDHDYREEARELLDSEGFASENSQFFRSGGKSDWFQIGGRWSGVLAEASGKLTKQKLNDQFARIEDKDRLIFTGEEGKRDGFNSRSDDSQILTKELMARLVKTYKVSEAFYSDEEKEEQEELTLSAWKDSLDKQADGYKDKVIVVVDYHY